MKNNPLNEELYKETFVEEAISKFGKEKVDTFLALAWEQGHSGGEGEVKSKLIDILFVANVAVK